MTVSTVVGDRLLESRAFRSSMRRLYDLRGGRAMAHAVRSRLYRERTVVIDDFDGDLQFECHLDEHMGTQIFWRGRYSASQLALLDRLLTDDGMTFFDVGANQGEFALFAAKRLRHGRVVAFEPDPKLCTRLRRNLNRNGFDWVDVREEALWFEGTTMTLYQPIGPCYDGSINEGLGSLYASDDALAAVEVPCRRLDDVVAELGIDRLDVIKIDVEGAEPDVLRGAEATIDRFAPQLLVEADRDRSAASGYPVDRLLDGLSDRYALHVVESGGRTTPLDRSTMRSHENLLCVPRQLQRVS